MWHIGGIDLEGRVVLGPMSGVTSVGYRRFMEPFGVATSVTEMTSDAGVIHIGDRYNPFVEFESDVPTGLQLFGCNPDMMAEGASKALRMNPSIAYIDVNMGCPVAKIVRNGAGSALMRVPERCAEIVRSIRSKAEVPVTAKIRLGWSMASVNFETVIESLTEAGADAVALHVRTKEEQYYGHPHYELAEGLQKRMSVPLIISGNIDSLGDARDALRITGADAVMIARGGVGNPFLVTQIDRYLRTGDILPNPTVAQQIDWCLELTDMIIEEKGEEQGMRRMRMFAPKFIAGCCGCREYRRDLALNIRDRDSMVRMLSDIRERMGQLTINSQLNKKMEKVPFGTC